MRIIELRKVKQGEAFRLSDSDDAPDFIRDEYNRSARKFEAHKSEDEYQCVKLVGSQMVYVDLYEYNTEEELREAFLEMCEEQRIIIPDRYTWDGEIAGMFFDFTDSLLRDRSISEDLCEKACFYP